ncbi:ImmA/IrrE family metallo-endopeptidase [Oceanobacillus saliphilus]|uniref:ImmA/IrrE family metallo-endopeptidase n=1 Tax=Oceanobacillus saliphilus TaxID=2925834 RepID=UPI00201DAF7D|nr:ImmA/IrrE family metallo-endopeptidase [Oceanobacillus saliphilus]
MYYTHVEEYVHDLYKGMHIREPHQLEIPRIANKLEINIQYASVNMRIMDVIFLKRSSKQREWQAFGHEVCHYLRHSGNQLSMFYMFRDLQEWQADSFAYHFCIPTFMLQEIKHVTVYEVMSKFNVEYKFAINRLEMYKRKMVDT